MILRKLHAILHIHEPEKVENHSLHYWELSKLEMDIITTKPYLHMKEVN